MKTRYGTTRPSDRNPVRRSADIARNSMQQGSMLLEALIAILIFSMGILAIVGLQSASIKHTTDTKYRTDASFLANQYLGQMWVDRANLSSYATASTALDSLPSGTRTISVTGNEVTITITWQLPGESTAHRFVTIAQING